MRRRWLIVAAVAALAGLMLWWLVPTLAWSGLVAAVGDWFASHRDAGDWIALGALVASGIGLLHARSSARAARYSARFAAEVLPLAQRSADAAMESAQAANRSADIAEAVRHREEAPTWVVVFDRVEDGVCVVKATIKSCPAVIDVLPFYSGEIFGQASADGSLSSTLVANQLDRHKFLHKGDRIHFPVKVPDDVGVPSFIKLTVVLPSVDSRRYEVDPEQTQPWDYSETLHWRQPPEQPFFVAFA